MNYVYVLQSKKDSWLYTGCTNDLKKRFALHNSGKVTATASRVPLILIYYEGFINKHDAFMREQYLKTGWGRSYIRKVLSHTLSAKNLDR